MLAVLILMGAPLATPASADLFDFLSASRYDRNSRDGMRRLNADRPARYSIKPKETEVKEPIPPGQLHIIVSVADQKVRVFADGKIVATEPVSTGMAGHLTPMGVFSVIGKSRLHHSNIYSGAPMPFMQRITWSGVALHAGVLPGYPASHGCIRMPEKFANRLFDISKIGARVIVSRETVEPVEIVHARLLQPKKPEEKPSDVPVAAAPAASEPAKSEQAKIEPVKAIEVKTADVTGTLPMMAPESIIAPEPVAKPSSMIEAVPKKSRYRVAPTPRKGPVQVFISRKQAKMFVRVAFAPVFEAPVKIADPDKPWGTHVFTAMELKDGGAAMRWSAVTIPSGYLPKVDDKRPAAKPLPNNKLAIAAQARLDKLAADLAAAPTAAEALDRFEIPQDALERITALLDVGSAITISDNPLSEETGQETDFVVLTSK